MSLGSKQLRLFWRWLKNKPWTTIVNTTSTIVMAFATVFMAIVASNTQDIQRAIGQISKLADAAFRQADSANDLAIATKKNFVAAERPWLKIDPEPGSDIWVIKTKEGITLGGLLALKFTNTGKTPAFQVDPAWAAHDWSGPVASLQKQICAKIKRVEPAKVASSLETIFPGQSQELRLGFALQPSDVEAAQEVRRRFYGKSYWSGVTPIVYGCINYRSSLDNEWHQTWFAYSIETKKHMDGGTYPLVPHTYKKEELEVRIVPLDAQGHLAD